MLRGTAAVRMGLLNFTQLSGKAGAVLTEVDHHGILITGSNSGTDQEVRVLTMRRRALVYSAEVLPSLCLFSGLWMLSSGCIGADQKNGAANDGVSYARQRIVEAQSPADKAKAYRTFYEAVGRGRLSEFEEDADLGIGLQACWESTRVLQEGAERVEGINIDPVRCDRFLKFLRRRLGSDPPVWWKKTLKAAQIVPGERTIFWGDSAGSYHSNSYPLRTPSGIDLRDEPNDIVLSLPNGQVRLAKGVLESSLKRYPAGNLVALMSTNRVFLACYSDWGRRFEIICLNSKDGTIVWRSEVWGVSWQREISSFSSGHQVSLTLSEDQLLVFGADAKGVYIEALNATNGQIRLRFCSSYWCNDPERWKF